MQQVATVMDSTTLEAANCPPAPQLGDLQGGESPPLNRSSYLVGTSHYQKHLPIILKSASS